MCVHISMCVCVYISIYLLRRIKGILPPERREQLVRIYILKQVLLRATHHHLVPHTLRHAIFNHTPKGIKHKVGGADIDTAELVGVPTCVCVCVCVCVCKITYTSILHPPRYIQTHTDTHIHTHPPFGEEGKEELHHVGVLILLVRPVAVQDDGHCVCVCVCVH